MCNILRIRPMVLNLLNKGIIKIGKIASIHIPSAVVFLTALPVLQR